MLWHLNESEDMLKFYRDFILKAPHDVYGYFAFLTVPPVPLFPQELHLKKMCGIVWCVLGDRRKAINAVDTFREYKTPALDYTAEIPYAALQGMFDPLYPKGLQWYWKADFVKDLPDEAISLNVKYAEKLPTPHSTMHLIPSADCILPVAPAVVTSTKSSTSAVRSGSCSVRRSKRPVAKRRA